MGNSFKTAKTDYSRVFIIAGRARPDHAPEYNSQLKLGGLSQSFGDVTKVEIPDPDRYGEFVEVDRIRGTMERATAQLMGRYAANLKSRLLELARQGCPVDVQVHFGDCSDPSAFNTFTKSVIIEDVILTSHSADDFGALGSDERASINETTDISGKEYFEVMPLSMAQRAGDIVTNQVNDITFFDVASCGTCGVESDGCKLIFAVTNGAGGSPSTPADIVFSLDGGTSWKAHDVDALATANAATCVAGIGDYVVVGSNVGKSLHYALVQDFRDGVDPSFTAITGLSRGPNAMASAGRFLFIVGDFGFVWYTDDITSGVTVADAGAATVSKLNAVDAVDKFNAVAVGNDGAVIFTSDGLSWDVCLSKPVGTGTHLTDVVMKSETEWFVTTSNGYIYYTLNAGKSWTRKTMPGTAPSKMSSIAKANDSVMYASGVVNSLGRMYRSFDGGYSWVVLPESVGSMPQNQEIVKVAACEGNVNIVAGGGIAVGGTDGFIVVGKG